MFFFSDFVLISTEITFVSWCMCILLFLVYFTDFSTEIWQKLYTINQSGKKRQEIQQILPCEWNRQHFSMIFHANWCVGNCNEFWLSDFKMSHFNLKLNCFRNGMNGKMPHSHNHTRRTEWWRDWNTKNTNNLYIQYLCSCTNVCRLLPFAVVFHFSAFFLFHYLY